MEDTVGLCDSDVIHRSKSQIILFYAHMNKANGAGKICKLLSNWPVSRLKPCQTTVREGESRSESNVENYWIGFSCHSQHISLSNFSSHHDHGSALSPWRAGSFSRRFEKRGGRFSSLLYLTPPPVWLAPQNTDNAREQVFTGSHPLQTAQGRQIWMQRRLQDTTMKWNIETGINLFSSVSLSTTQPKIIFIILSVLCNKCW